VENQNVAGVLRHDLRVEFAGFFAAFAKGDGNRSRGVLLT
jgi:hypothetical protein